MPALDYGSPSLLALRRFGQRLGVLRPVVRAYRRIFRTEYEASFDRAIESALRPGAVVWDVGANIGHYTQNFADRVGPEGMVLAFEPSPPSAALLRSRFGEMANVRIEEVALSDVTGSAAFFTSDESVTDGLFEGSMAAAGATVEVPVCRGDSYPTELWPNIVKIDVEGFELEVLEGLVGILPDDRLEHLFVEVHFLNLAKRGRGSAPNQIVTLLRKHGFRAIWVDPSHIAASRARK